MTINKLIQVFYDSQKQRCKRRNHALPKYTKQELKDWVLLQPHFKELYNNWVKSGHDKWLKPSVDIIDDNKSYSFDNIQLVTWKYNNDKRLKGLRNGKLKHGNKPQKAILQFDSKGNLLKEFPSASQAGRVLGIRQNRISEICNDVDRKNKTGFNFEFKKDGLSIRNTIKSDYITMLDWWSFWRFPAPPFEILPDNISDGLMVSYSGYNLCSGFIYRTSSKNLFWCEWVVSTYKIKDKEIRKKGIKFLIEGLTYMAKEMGAKVIYTSLVNPKLKEVFLDSGFVMGSSKADEMIYNL